MATVQADWHYGRWELSAPQTYLLLHHPAAQGAEMLKLALVELEHRKILQLQQIEEPDKKGRVNTFYIATPGPEWGTPVTPDLQAILDVYLSTKPQTFSDGRSGVRLTYLVTAVRHRYKTSLQKFVDSVIPFLVTSGYLTAETRRTFWLFQSTQHILTDKGSKAREALLENRQVAESQFRTWVDQDPARAAAFLAMAGSAVLLMNPLHPEIGRLQDVMMLRREEKSSSCAIYACGSSASDVSDVVDSCMDSGGGCGGSGCGGDGGGGCGGGCSGGCGGGCGG